MKQENKELLLKDLCSRLPYGVVVELDEKFGFNKGTHSLVKELLDLYCVEGIKPYLRPMSSMTKEEAKELSVLYGFKDILSAKITDKYVEFVVDDGFCSRKIWYEYDDIISSIEIFDWLNKHNFDYRGLIPMDLAIEVTEENNPYKD